MVRELIPHLRQAPLHYRTELKIDFYCRNLELILLVQYKRVLF